MKSRTGPTSDAGTNATLLTNAQLASSTDILAENPKLSRQADAGPPPGCHYEMQPAMEVTQRFVWGLDYIDEKIASYGPDGSQYFTLQDANYNVVGKVRGYGMYELYQYAYDPYGQIIAAENVANGQSLDINLNGELPDTHYFAGAWLDKETGLVWMRHRLYSPQQMRFISQDPDGQALVLGSVLARNAQSMMATAGLSMGSQYRGGANLYAYTNGNPVTRLDPTGLFDSAYADPFFDDFNDPFDEVESVIAGIWADRQAAEIEAVQRAKMLRDIAIDQMMAIAKRSLFEGVATAVVPESPYYFAAYDALNALQALYREGLSWESAGGLAMVFFQVKATYASGVSIGLPKIRKGLLRAHLRFRERQYHSSLKPTARMPIRSLAGKSPSQIRKLRPKTWKELPADTGHGWKWIDEAGNERLRYMYPKKNGRFVHERTGYFRWADETGASLDMWGRVADPSDYEVVHIVPQVE